MSGWTRHEKMYAKRRAPATYRGHGSFYENADKSDTDFQLDEQSGLFLPETVTKERRKVTIGFHMETEDVLPPPMIPDPTVCPIRDS